MEDNHSRNVQTHEVKTDTTVIKEEEHRNVENSSKEIHKNNNDDTNNSMSSFCFALPKERDFCPIDNLLCTNERISKFKNKILNNLGTSKVTYDLRKVNQKENLLSSSNNNTALKNDKWYLKFQPLHNVNIDPYWKYQKVTLMDIMNANVHLRQNIELKKNKKYLKNIAKTILSGTPHESLVKSCYKIDTVQNKYDQFSKIPLDKWNPSLLSLNTFNQKNTKNFLNWKLKCVNNFSGFQQKHQQQQHHYNHQTQQQKYKVVENSSAVNASDHTRQRGRYHNKQNQGNSDIVLTKQQKGMKDTKKKIRKK